MRNYTCFYRKKTLGNSVFFGKKIPENSRKFPKKGQKRRFCDFWILSKMGLFWEKKDFFGTFLGLFWDFYGTFRTLLWDFSNTLEHFYPKLFKGLFCSNI